MMNEKGFPQNLGETALSREEAFPQNLGEDSEPG